MGHRVRLQHEGKVPAGVEVQLVVDLVAPQRAGRYITNFRLVTPSGKKFGQRFWCTVNVVDSDAAGEQHGASDDKLVEAAATAEATTAPAPALPSTGADVATAGDVASAAAPTAAEPPPSISTTGRTLSAPDVTIAATTGVSGVAVVERTTDEVPEPVGDADGKSDVVAGESRVLPAADGTSKGSNGGQQLSDLEKEVEVARQQVVALEMRLLQAKEKVSPPPSNGDSDSVCSDTVVISAEEQVAASLEAMGFTDPELNAAVIEREQGTLEACAGTLLTLSEWSKPLGDLKVMGFVDVRRNVDVLLKHDGDIRLTVKELISA